jgi:hypothetical protein
VDFAPSHRQPSAGARVIAASVVSVIGSLAADALLVVIGTAIFPSTKGYGHFQFSDYAKLTIIGVVIACLAWPVVTRISSAPRWLFFRLAIAGHAGACGCRTCTSCTGAQPGRAVAVLMVMHLAIAWSPTTAWCTSRKVEPVAHGRARSSGSDPGGSVARRGS